MSSGTGGGCWADKALPSVFKHELLRRCLPQFGRMTGSHSHDKRVVYLDGYAGEGRYENGDPASAEIALRIASHPRSKHGLTLDCFFTEAGTGVALTAQTARLPAGVRHRKPVRPVRVRRSGRPGPGRMVGNAPVARGERQPGTFLHGVADR